MKIKSINLIKLVSKQVSNENILIAFSGGQDSISLIILCFGIKSQNSLILNLLWNNHLWHKDSFFLARHTTKLGYLFQVALHSPITTTSVKTELGARHWRLKSSRRLQSFYNYHKIMQAHTGTDKIETLLLNLFRGTGNTSPFYFTDFLRYLSQKQTRKLYFS